MAGSGRRDDVGIAAERISGQLVDLKTGAPEALDEVPEGRQRFAQWE